MFSWRNIQENISTNTVGIEFSILFSVIWYAKQKQPGCKKVRGQSEATMVIGDQNSDIK